MESKTFELDDINYNLTNPVDFLLNWALKAAEDDFKSKESLDQISKVIRAVCPDIPERYFFAVDGLTIPLIDTYKIIDFIAKLVVAAIERRIKVIESIPPEDRASLKFDINEKIKQFREVADGINKRFTELQFNLILGGIEVTQKKEASPYIPHPSSNGSKLASLKRQVEELTSEISSLERV